METKPFSLQSPEEIAKDYGGNKQKIAQAAQMGMLDPTSAVLAGMFIDRMRSAQMQEQAPQQTVAQQVLAPQPQGMPQGAPAMPPQGAGLEALPVPDNMFGAPGMASGGLVAFAEAGEVGLDPLEEQRRRDREALSQAGILGPLVEGQEAAGSFFDWLANQRERSKQLRLQREQVLSGQVMPPLTPQTQPTPADDINYDVLDQALNESRAPTVSMLDEVEVVETIPEEQRVRTSATPTPTPTAQDEESALAQYAKMLMGSMQDKEAGREDARNMALLQAGLGIMGGESPYALQNIARGALPATQSYQQQMQQMREDERKTIGALADLELKARELGLTEQRYRDLAEIGRAQVMATLGKSSTTGQFTQKDYTKAILDATKAIMANDPTIDPEEAANLARDQVNAVLGGGQQTQEGARTIDFSQLGR